MRPCLQGPIPELFETWNLLNKAADAHLVGDFAQADAYFQASATPEVYEWLDKGWRSSKIHLRHKNPPNMPSKIPECERDPVEPPLDVQQAIIARDGYRCRYCGIPVIRKELREWLRRQYPSAIWWGTTNEKKHWAFQCLWHQWEHVVPRSLGGKSDYQNVVTSCAVCNYGKWEYTLAQLDLVDPRTTPFVRPDWDGLERVRQMRRPKRS